MRRAGGSKPSASCTRESRASERRRRRELGRGETRAAFRRPRGHRVRDRVLRAGQARLRRPRGRGGLLGARVLRRHRESDPQRRASRTACDEGRPHGAHREDPLSLLAIDGAARRSSRSPIASASTTTRATARTLGSVCGASRDRCGRCTAIFRGGSQTAPPMSLVLRTTKTCAREPTSRGRGLRGVRRREARGAVQTGHATEGPVGEPRREQAHDPRAGRVVERRDVARARPA